MVEFSVRIDFYRDLEGPKDYVGSALRDGLSAVVDTATELLVNLRRAQSCNPSI